MTHSKKSVSNTVKSFFLLYSIDTVFSTEIPVFKESRSVRAEDLPPDQREYYDTGRELIKIDRLNEISVDRSYEG